MDEILVNHGGAVKAVGEGRVQGYLVQFSDADNPDMTRDRDFFTPTETDFDFEDGERRSVYFHHGLDGTMKSTKLGRVEMKADSVGVWVDGILNLRDDYERAIYELAAKGKLGWSSGAPVHLVRREKIAGKNANKVTHWPIAEASLTPNPADWRNDVVAIKSADVGGTLFADLLREIEGEPPTAEVKTADTHNETKADAEAEPVALSVIEVLQAMPIKAFLEQMGSVCTEAERRIAWYVDDRCIKSGRTISADNLRAMSAIADGMDSVHSALDTHRKKLRALVEQHAKPADTTPNLGAREFNRYMGTLANGSMSF